MKQAIARFIDQACLMFAGEDVASLQQFHVEEIHVFRSADAVNLQSYHFRFLIVSDHLHRTLYAVAFWQEITPERNHLFHPRHPSDFIDRHLILVIGDAVDIVPVEADILAVEVAVLEKEEHGGEDENAADNELQGDRDAAESLFAPARVCFGRKGFTDHSPEDVSHGKVGDQ